MEQVGQIMAEAGKRLKERYSSSFGIWEKEKGHLAADVDAEIEEFIKERLYNIDPSIGFYGEESAEGGQSAMAAGGRRWIVDSLDGTANFIFGVPYFCTSVALEDGGRIKSALVYNPVTEELFEAEEGRGGAFCNGSPINVSSADVLKSARVVFGFSANYKNIDRYHREWEAAFDGCLKGLGLLSPAMNLCNAARGRIDAFVDFGCSMEGQAAGGYILKKAGGLVLNYDRKDWNHRDTGIIATNGILSI